MVDFLRITNASRRVNRTLGGYAAVATLALSTGLTSPVLAQESVFIGVIFPSQNQVRWAWEQKFFTEQATANGDKVIFQFSNENVATQKTQVESFIERGVNVIVMAAIDANAGNELVNEAHSQGVKVVTYDRGVSTAKVDYHISRSNYEAGKLQAEAALSSVPAGDYAIIRGDVSTIAQVDMSRAYDELLKNKAGVNIVYDELTPGWDSAVVQRNAEAALQKAPDIKAFAVMWDDAAQAVVQALKSAGRQPGEVFVSGLDSATPSLTYIAQGWQTQTIWTPIDEMARSAADVAHALGVGKKVPAPSEVVDGVPHKYVKLVSITKTNLCDFITKIAPSGWVTQDDVFGKAAHPCK
ncbi:substrate-binding domain-containing protein (plasmid) [Rhizobium leguminosarum]